MGTMDSGWGSGRGMVVLIKRQPELDKIVAEMAAAHTVEVGGVSYVDPVAYAHTHNIPLGILEQAMQHPPNNPRKLQDYEIRALTLAGVAQEIADRAVTFNPIIKIDKSGSPLRRMIAGE